MPPKRHNGLKSKAFAVWFELPQEISGHLFGEKNHKRNINKAIHHYHLPWNCKLSWHLQFSSAFISGLSQFFRSLCFLDLLPMQHHSPNSLVQPSLFSLSCSLWGIRPWSVSHQRAGILNISSMFIEVHPKPHTSGVEVLSVMMHWPAGCSKASNRFWGRMPTKHVNIMLKSMEKWLKSVVRDL